MEFRGRALRLGLLAVAIGLAFLLWSAWKFIQRDSCLDVGGWWRYDENRCEHCYDNNERYTGGPFCTAPAPEPDAGSRR